MKISKLDIEKGCRSLHHQLKGIPCHFQQAEVKRMLQKAYDTHTTGIKIRATK